MKCRFFPRLQLCNVYVRRQWISGRQGRPPVDRAVSENAKKRKSTSDDGSIDVKVACTDGEDDSDVAKRSCKKKGFSWNQYFSEEIGIAAPPRLFKNVLVIFYTRYYENFDYIYFLDCPCSCICWLLFCWLIVCLLAETLLALDNYNFN